MINNGTGNQVANDDFLQVLLALKDATMRATNVAEVCQVISTGDTNICKIITTKEDIECIALAGLHLDEGDIVLVVFTNTDFRATLKKIKSGSETQATEDKVLHTKSNGVIVGLIYKQN